MKTKCFPTVMFLVVGFISGCLASRERIQQGRFVKHKGVRGGGEVLRTATVRYATECARLCMSTDSCNLYNLGPEDDWTRRMRCELVTRNSTAVDVSGIRVDLWAMYTSESKYVHSKQVRRSKRGQSWAPACSVK